MASLTTLSGVTVNVADDKVDRLLASGSYFAGSVPTGDPVTVSELARTSEQNVGAAPRGNASRDAWASYADGLGVEYDEGAGRDDIKAAVEASDQK